LFGCQTINISNAHTTHTNKQSVGFKEKTIKNINTKYMHTHMLATTRQAATSQQPASQSFSQLAARSKQPSSQAKVLAV